VHKEEAAVACVVRDFKVALPDAAVYVYDNNSTDRTAAARAAGAVVRSEPLQGKGNVVHRMFADVEAAVTFTWAMNRWFTFAGADPRRGTAQWGCFVAANGVGALVNYGTYAALVALVPLVAARPVLGVAAGSVAGLVFNFTLSKLWVFHSVAD
jgi:putative flippase GtrA